jgi:hypothetical protein
MRHLNPIYLQKAALISNAGKRNNAGENATLREKKTSTPNLPSSNAGPLSLNAKPPISKRQT